MITSDHRVISLTFDDALDEHLDQVQPLLDKAGLRGTFYAHLSAPSLSRRAPEWRQLSQMGHELGNHTIFHPADIRKQWVREGNAIDLYTLDRMEMELSVANDWLHSIDGQTERTFAYPCSNSVLGSYGWVAKSLFRMGLRQTRWPGLMERCGLDFGNTRQTYEPLTPKLFRAARGGGLYLADQSPELSRMNRYCLPSAAVEDHSFEQMRDFVTRSLKRPTWSILQFHGVGGGHHMNCDLTEFQKFVDWLAEHHGNRIVTVVDGARTLFGSPTQTTF
jgi:hypothetical protein